MDWPKSLVEELASRRCLIFLGAGASAGCVGCDGSTRPPRWSKLLEELNKYCLDPAKKAFVADLIRGGSYLDAAEILTQLVPEADFSRFIREVFVQPRYKHCSIHESVLRIDPKLVITTNFDEIYDGYCRSGAAVDGYAVLKYYDENIVSNLRSPVRLIVKAHGCVTDTAKIVLSRLKYYEAKQKCRNFYTVLDALFLTHTVLFLGYSLSDPDIQLVLENSNISARSNHPHYALIEDSMAPELETVSSKTYNIHFIKHPAGDFLSAAKKISELADAVEEHRRVFSA